MNTFRNHRRPRRPLSRHWFVALLGVVGLVFTSAALGATYPSPPHDFGPVAGARPLYNAANAATPRPLLVIQTTFTDIATPAGLNDAATAARVFGPSFPNLGGYFSAVSFGKLTFTPAPETCGTTNDGVVTVNVGDSATFIALADPALNRTVLDAVNALGCVDFSKFDANSDGNLTDTEIGFLQIDATPRNCGATRSITPGASYNGKTIDSGKGMSDSASATNILTLAHEVGHQTLDTRDLYGFGAGSFDLYGPTCGAPDTTMFEFNAWQKLHLGWVTPTVVSKDGYYTVPRADTTPAAFLLYDPDKGTNDFFMVENREPTAGTYDKNASDSGLVIWRADDAQYNSAVDTVRPIDIMRPDATTNPGCSGGTCYGGSNGDAWDPSDLTSLQRTMSRTWRDGTASNVAVRAIPDKSSSMRVYFDVRGPGVLVDTYALQHAAPTNVTLGEAGSISFPVMNTGEGSDSFDFTATGLPAGWTATTDTRSLGAGAGGTATITVTPPITAATGYYTLNAAGTSAADSTVTSNSPFVVNVVRRPTSIVYTGDLAADYHDGAAVSATLTDTISGLPLSAKQVSFAVGTQTTSGTTNASGVASSTITLDQTPAGVVLGASFFGDATYLGSSALGSFTISKEETSLAYGGPTVILAGTSGATVTAHLVEDGANDSDGDGGSAAPSPAGQTITFAISSDTCSGTTDSSGIATCTIPNVSGSALGPKALVTSFAGDAYYLASSDSDQVVVFAFPTRGVFVLGNSTVATATPTTVVSWWSDSWWQLNRVSGGTAPSSFKGFAGTVTSLPTQSPATVCGTQFVTTTGNSPPPVGGVPSYMGVIVASSVTKNGSAVNGVWGKIVVVRTNPGYAPTPDHPGTGTIVATFCP